MKKKIILLLLIPFLTSCFHQYPLVSGDYISERVLENDYFSDAKFSLIEIDEKTYNEANFINVIKDRGSYNDKKNVRKNRKYYRFNLYIFVIPLDKFVQFDIGKFSYIDGTSGLYNTYLSCSSPEFSLEKTFAEFENSYNKAELGFQMQCEDETYQGIRFTFKKV